jgi:hypothetical protein
MENVVVREGVFLDDLSGWYGIALRNLFVSGVVRVGTWLEAELVVSDPRELPMASTFERSQDSQTRGEQRLESCSVLNDRVKMECQLTFVLIWFILVGLFIVVRNLGHTVRTIFAPN